MLGEQGGNSRCGDEEKKDNEEKIEDAKNIFLFAAKTSTQKNQIDLG